MSNDAVDDLRFLYVWLLDAADGLRKLPDLENSEFAMGMATGYSAAGDAIKVILERHEN